MQEVIVPRPIIQRALYSTPETQSNEPHASPADLNRTRHKTNAAARTRIVPLSGNYCFALLRLVGVAPKETCGERAKLTQSSQSGIQASGCKSLRETVVAL